MKQPVVYIITNKKDGVLYTGVTSDLVKRIYQHKHSLIDGFSKKYNCTMLVFYELHENMESAISKEKRLKAGSRARKLELIASINPNWIDLYEQIL